MIERFDKTIIKDLWYLDSNMVSSGFNCSSPKLPNHCKMGIRIVFESIIRKSLKDMKFIINILIFVVLGYILAREL